MNLLLVSRTLIFIVLSAALSLSCYGPGLDWVTGRSFDVASPLILQHVARPATVPYVQLTEDFGYFKHICLATDWAAALSDFCF